MSLDLPLVDGPGHFPDLEDPHRSFILAGGEFLVVDLDGRVVGMGAIRGSAESRAEVLRVRVHPAIRRQGVGRSLMSALETRAVELGFDELDLDTTVEQPEAIAFYRALGYSEIGRQAFPAWELVYFRKQLRGGPSKPG
jgi:ribosomal protein S18 acetylase RimI-like enzyme